MSRQRNPSRVKIGDVFTRWTVIVESAYENHEWNCLCKCECGTERRVFECRLFNKTSKSCGCISRETASKLHRTHGLSANGKSSEYRIWAGMKNRCYNPKRIEFKHYGGRGISVCDRWRDSFENFLWDMGRRPSAKHSIDRINNDGNYEPSNCRWATWSEQNKNKRPRTSHQKKGKTK